MTDVAESDVLHFEGGPWDGLCVRCTELDPGDELIELRHIGGEAASIYRRRGDSRTYHFLAAVDDVNDVSP